MLKNNNGTWMEEEGDLKRHVNEYYKSLFTLKGGWIDCNITEVTFTELLNEDISRLKAQVDSGEIKKAFFFYETLEGLGSGRVSSKSLSEDVAFCWGCSL